MLQEKVHVVAKPNREKPPSFGLLRTNTATTDLQPGIQLLIIPDLYVHLCVYRVGRKGPLTPQVGQKPFSYIYNCSHRVMNHLFFARCITQCSLDSSLHWLCRSSNEVCKKLPFLAPEYKRAATPKCISGT